MTGPRQYTYRPRRRRKRYVINKKRLVISILVLLVTAELIYMCLTSPLFTVREVHITGNTIIRTADVLKAADIPDDQNLFLVSKDEIEDRIKASPVVNSIKIHRRLPGSMTIDVEERRPHLLLKSQDVLYEVDAQGVPFRIVDKRKDDIPVVSCTVQRRIVLGRPIKSTSFQSARDCLLLVQEKKIPGFVRITVDPGNDLCLNVRDEFQVILGGPDQLSDKLDIALQVMQIPEFQQRGKYIDVTCLEASVYKLKD